MKTINCKILGMRCQLHMDNRERIGNDSKNNNVTNATETFFFFFCARECLRRFRLHSKGNTSCNNKRGKSKQGKPSLPEWNSCCNSFMWLFGCKTILWLTSFAWSWWLDIGRVFITCFTAVKNVKTTTPEDFNLLTVPINSVKGTYSIQIKYQGFYLFCFDFRTYFNHFYSVHFGMSKLSKSDRGRQKDNLWQSKHGLWQGNAWLVSFGRSSRYKNAYLMSTKTPM